MDEKKYYLGFSNFPGIGPIKFGLLLKHFGSAKAAWISSTSELEQVIGKSLTAKFIDFRRGFDIEKYEGELLKKKIDYIVLSDKDYPPLLKQISNPPIVLYIKGDRSLFHSQILENLRMIAIVGTRRITSYGRSVTDLFSASLASSGLIIISGLAIGVDAQAHTSCLEIGGKTVAVLGNGVDVCYPRENQKIYDQILDGHGAIISEYPPGEPPSVGSFPARNRIVAGLSDGVLVTEGASDSGSLITANFGLEFGRKVFAVPGPITSSLSAAPLRLIEKGAKLVITPGDILRNFQLPISNFQSNKNDPMFKNLTKEEKKIIELIENEPMSFDEIIRHLDLDSSKVGSLLSVMEIKGLIKNSGGSYSIVS